MNGPLAPDTNGPARPPQTGPQADSAGSIPVTRIRRSRPLSGIKPDHPRMIHWSIPDPAREDSALTAFRHTAAELDSRIRYLLPSLAD